MKLKCTMCDGTEFMKHDGGVYCQNCTAQYTLEQARGIAMVPEFADTSNQNSYIPPTAVPNELPKEAYCSLAKHVLLLLFTLGIWRLIWIYKTTGYLNCVADEPPRNPTTKLLLCMFIPFYSIYWAYKSAQRIDKLAKEKDISSDLSALCLILEIFIAIIPPILMQDKINAIVTQA